MSLRTARFCGFAAAALVLPVPALAQLEALVADTGLDAVYRLVDLTLDGDFDDADEIVPFFDASNASGLVGATGNIFSLLQLPDGSVLVGDGGTDTVYRLFDANRDGDANDADEASVFYSGINGAPIQSPNGLAFDGDAVYILTAGAGSAPVDAIVRCRDLNGNGKADDENEATTWLDLNQVSGSSAFGMVIAGGVHYLVDTLGGGDDVVFRAADSDMSGTADAMSELDVFLSTGTVPISVGFGITAHNNDLFVISGSGSAQTLTRLRDGDGSGTIDASEAVAVWDESLISPAVLATAFDLVAFERDGRLNVLIVSSGADSDDGVVLLTDLDGDGAFTSMDESGRALSGNGAGVFPDTARAVAIYVTPPPACPGDFNHDQTVDLADLIGFNTAWQPNIGQSVPAGTMGDYNADGVVDLADLIGFNTDWQPNIGVACP